MAEDGSAEGPSTDRIAMDIDMARNGLQFFCIKFGGCRKDEANTILDFLLRIKKKNILSAGANINGKNSSFYPRVESGEWRVVNKKTSV